MKAAVLYEARQPLKIEELKMPDVDEEDVLIKVASCGVCHTDLKVVEGRNRFTPPTILGHEVAGTVEEKLAAAKSFGATHTINATAEDPVKAVIKLTDSGVDKAFEAIGNPKTSDQIIQATRPGGTATIIGGLGNGPFTISSGRFVTSEITITGVSSRQANDIEEVFQMATLGRIELKSLITKSYRYDQINEALADLEHGKLRMAVSLWN